MSNLPDDWNDYWYTCHECGKKYHASEGGCGCTDDMTKCAGCEEWFEEEELVEVPLDSCDSYCRGCADAMED